MSSGDTKANPRLGRVRQPTKMELAEQDFLLRPDAVLSITHTDAELTPLERHVASLIDGFRPIARVKKKSGLSSAEVLDALRNLRKRSVLKLVGIIEEYVDDAVDPVVSQHGHTLEEVSVPHGTGEVIPAHIMREIEQMVAEIAENRECARDTHRSITVINDEEP